MSEEGSQYPGAYEMDMDEEDDTVVVSNVRTEYDRFAAGGVMQPAVYAPPRTVVEEVPEDDRDTLLQSTVTMELSPQKKIKRQDAVVFGQRPAGKGPMWANRPMDIEEDSDSDGEVPDLASYFDEFSVPMQERAKICRAYASFVSAQLRMTKRKRK